MKANHIPAKERIQNRIIKFQIRYEDQHIKSPTKGNPYYCCKECGIYDPELSVRGKHFTGCNSGGLEKEIYYYKSLLDNLK